MTFYLLIIQFYLKSVATSDATFDCLASGQTGGKEMIMICPVFSLVN